MTSESQSQIKSSPYVDLNTLEALSLESQEYVKRRWLSEVRWFASATRRSKRTYFALSITTLVSSALTALLASWTGFSHLNWSPIFVSSLS
jgi:hypothetical protein